jgi:carbon monoxide dehydrogenase subunit G
MSFRTESKIKEVNKSPEKIFNFLRDFHNFKNLLPEDKIENWQCTPEHCSFTLKGLAELSIHVKTKVENKLVHYSSDEGAKFPFDLYVDIEEFGQISKCKVYMDLHMNPAVKFFAQKPIQNFVNKVAEKIEETDF